MVQNVVQKMQSIVALVVGFRLPRDAATSSNAVNDGKEPTRMKNRAESVHTANQERLSPFRKLIAIGALSTLALTGCASNDAEAQPAPTETTQVSPEPTPTETTPEVPFEELVAEHEIPAGLEEEALRDAVVGFFNDWLNAGADDSIRAIKREMNQPWDAVCRAVAEENGEIYATALFGADWRNDPEIVELVESRINANASILEWFTATEWNTEDPQNQEGFRAWMEGISISNLERGDGTATYEITYSWHDNSELNSAPEEDEVTRGQIYMDVIDADGVMYATRLDMRNS